MTLAEFEAIRKRAADAVKMPTGANAVIICERGGQPIHPVELGFQEAKQFQAHCEAIGFAMKDRLALLEMIEKDFDLADYFKVEVVEEPKPE